MKSALVFLRDQMKIHYCIIIIVIIITPIKLIIIWEWCYYY